VWGYADHDKYNRMGWAERVAHIRKKSMHTTFCESQKKSDLIGDIGVDGRIIFKWK
jgi:hypothetical protein